LDSDHKSLARGLSSGLKACLQAVLALFLIVAWHGATASAAEFHHDLTVELRPETHSLSVQDSITADSTPGRDLVFSIAKQARILSVTVNGKSARHSFKSGELAIAPGSPASPRPLGIMISFEAAFDDHVPSAPADFDNPGFGVEGAISGKGTFLLAGSGWYPRVDGENAFSLKVIAPKGIYAVTAGELVGHEDKGDRSISTWKIERLSQGLALSAARYSIRSEKSGRVPVYTYFFPESDSLSETYLKAAASHIAFYESLHGPYAFPKFAVVENFFPTGYGFPSYTLLGSQVLRLPFIPQTSLRHEIAHCWWGNGVLVDYDAGNWSEGLTTYVADYLSRELASLEEAERYRRQILRDYSTLAAAHGDLPLSRFLGRIDPATRAVGYGKAAFLFHMIRQRIGEEPFWRSLRMVYRERFQARTSWEDFRRAFVTEGGWDDLESKHFLDQWVSRSGAPVLRLNDVQALKDVDKWKVTGTVSQSDPSFQMEARLTVTTSAGDPVATDTKLEGAVSSFVMHTAAPPEKLFLDRHANLFRLLFPEEVPATVNSLKSATDLVVVIGDGVVPGAEATLTILLAGLNHPDAAALPEKETDIRLVRDKDILFFGIPKSDKLRELLAAAPGGLSLSPDGFSLDGTFSSEKADSLFLVINDRDRSGKITALFLPVSGADADSIATAARKITHYGQYSYLTFLRGTNQEKGTWEVSRSPLIVDFRKNGELP